MLSAVANEPKESTFLAFWWQPHGSVKAKRWSGLPQDALRVIYPDNLIAYPSFRYKNGKDGIALIKFKGKKHKPSNLFIIDESFAADYTHNTMADYWPNGYYKYLLENGTWVERVKPEDISEVKESNYLLAVPKYSTEDTPVKEFASSSEFFDYLQKQESKIDKLFKENRYN